MRRQFGTVLRENFLGLSLSLIGVACLALAGVIYFTHRSSPANVEAGTARLSSAQVRVLEEQNQAFAAIARAVTPAIVNVGTTQVVQVQQSPFFSDPFFQQFFGDFFGQFGIPRERREHSLGSGVIVSSSGHIVTNHHVIARAQEIEILLSDRRVFQGKLLGADPATDIAVIKIDGKDLPTVPWGDSSGLEVGDTVLAFGNPFGLNFTVTRGIISDVGRSGLEIEQYEDFIQTDAAINPGNSGGALVNVRGELVGINTAIVSSSQGGFSGVGFAIPSRIAQSVMEGLVKEGRVVRGFLGVSVMDLTPALAKEFKAPSLQGVLVADVSSSGPAREAGIRRGDIILALNGQEPTSRYQFQTAVASTKPGTQVTLRILRDGSPLTVRVTVVEQPGTGRRGWFSGRTPERSALRGITVTELSEEVLSQLGLPEDTPGVLITRVEPQSPAALAGLQRGDIIVEINRQLIRSVADYERVVSGLGSGTALLLINRQGYTAYVTLSTSGGNP